MIFLLYLQNNIETREIYKMKATKVLFIAQEITPYLPESEIANVCRYLPQGVQERGREIRTFMPKYGNINERRNQLHEVIRLSGMNLIIDDTDHPLIIKVASIQAARMQVYFIDNEDYFPLYIKKAYAEDPCFRDTKVIYSSYNNSFNSPFPASFSDKLLLEGIRKEDLNFTDKPIDFSELTKLAIRFSDGVIQASETMQPDILEYTKNAGIPFLPYQDPENYIDAYNEFYDVVWENAHK